jgi:hypothetical protein
VLLHHSSAGDNKAVQVTAADAQNAELAQPDKLQPVMHGLKATLKNARTAAHKGRPTLNALHFLTSIHHILHVDVPPLPKKKSCRFRAGG